jgi:hypothetical protein
LTFKAAYNNEWNFWDNVAIGVGIPNKEEFYADAHHWGKAFFRILKVFLLTPDAIVTTATLYVTRIRLHGGIPAYSLPDFFAHILLPSLQRHDLQVLEDRPALEKLLQSGTVQQFVDTPVLVFFRQGGDSAQRFFSKCRSMARLALNGEALPPAEALGLRPYLVEAFRKYWERRAEQAPGKTRRRWKAPKISFSAPHPPYYKLTLPEQVIPLEAAGLPYAWRVIGPDGEELAYPVRLYRPHYDVLTEGREVTIEQPWPIVKVVFSAGGKNVPPDLRREWPFTLLPTAQAPLLAFRDPDGKPLNAGAALPAEICWLLYPAGAELRFGGEAPCVETAQDYWPPWDAWRAAAYDLSLAGWVQVLPASGLPSAPLPVETRLDEPLLMGENLLVGSLPVEEKPLYVGLPPTLCLPRPPGQALEQALQRWQVGLEARYDADPGGRWAHKDIVAGAHILPDDPNIILLPCKPSWAGIPPAPTT